MRVYKCLVICFVMILLGSICNGQTQLNGRFYISGVSENPITPTSNYSIEGKFTDPLGIHYANEIVVGDMIGDSDGKMFRIDKITTLPVDNAPEIIADVTYLSGAIDEWTRYPAIFTTGTLFHPTTNGFALVTYDPENPNENLRIAMQNAAIVSIDEAVAGFTSGTVFPTTPKLGEGFYNTTEKKLYIYNGTEWMAVGSGTVPSGTSAEFPNPATKGDMFFNTDDNSSYIYNGTIWLKISTNGSVPSGVFNPDPAMVTVNEGSLFYNTSDHKLYVYNKTVWMPVDNILPNGQIYVGNTTSVATPVSMSGDATLNNSGKLTIVSKAITDEKLDKLNIPLSGFGNPTDNVSFGDGTTNNRVVNLANPTGSQDAATKNYVDALFTNPAALLNLPVGNFFVGSISNKAVATLKTAVPLSGFGAAAADVAVGGFKLTNVANPIAVSDAATKSYVDARIIDPSSITLATGSLLLGNATAKAGPVAKNTIALSGFGAAAADIAIGGFKLTNVADPVAIQDAATKNYVDTKTFDATSLNLASSSMFVGNISGKAIAILKNAIPFSDFAPASADISVGNFKITNLSAPLGNNDAATKKYIDDLFATPSTSLALATGKVFIGNASGKAVATSTSAIRVSDFGKATATINMGDAATQYNISYLAEPIFGKDAATKDYVDSKVGGSGTLTLTSGSVYVGDASNQASDVPKSSIPISDFGAANNIISLGNGTTNFQITNLADPTTPQDAATKSYVDSKTTSTQSGVTLPTTGQKASDTYYSTTDNHYYVYNGTTWVPMDNALASGQLYVGNASGIATGVDKSTIPLSGFAAPGADVALGNGTTNFKITNLADPIATQDAATKKYVDSKSTATQSGGTLPSTGQKASDTYYLTTDNHYYVYNGTTWVPVDNTLANGQLYVGNASGIASGVDKSSIPLSGFAAAGADLSLGNGTTNFKITNLADPIATQDAATKKYVDAKAISTQSGGTLPPTGQVGDTFYSTTDSRLYVYTGSVWSPVGNALPNGQLYVGNTSGIATATAKNTIPISGFDLATTNVAIGNGTNNFKIINLLDPTADQDAATKKYVDSKTASTKSGGTLPVTGQVGDTFYLTVDSQLYVYTATGWVPIGNDNLGNHTATKNLKMETFSISNHGADGTGLSFNSIDDATFAKDLTVNGNFYTPSDRQLKTNIETLNSVLQAINQIRGVRFEYKDQKKYATGPKIGIIAQELQKVYPEMVTKGEDGYLKVDYTQLTGVLIQGIKEQQRQILEQQQEINTLKNQMNKQQQQIDAILKKIQ